MVGALVEAVPPELPQPAALMAMPVNASALNIFVLFLFMGMKPPEFDG
ncbi:hypothetical protein TPY_1388 [Sulfobacillus acidophilus TPY]|nr:hypothetical protein TPY_1388 [Sulfobacillus acidophilus TPY]